MSISQELHQQISNAVRNSQRIEGYRVATEQLSGKFKNIHPINSRSFVGASLAGDSSGGKSLARQAPTKDVSRTFLTDTVRTKLDMIGGYP